MSALRRRATWRSRCRRRCSRRRQEGEVSTGSGFELEDRAGLELVDHPLQLERGDRGRRPLLLVAEVPAFTAARAGEPQLPSDAVVTELRDAADATTYRQIVEHALPHDVEVFDPAVERGVRRHPQPLPSGVFTVIVPDDERADSVVLLAGPDSRGAEHGRQAGPPGGPVELTRFPLR